MATIKSKSKGKIVKGITMSYDPKTFKEHKLANFYECSVEEMLKRIKPYEYLGRKFIFIDTETYAMDLQNHDMPHNVVRRWVGTGKKAIPQDFPFLFSICDGINCYSVFDDLDNKYIHFKKLKELLEDESIEKVLHNGNFDMHQLANIGLKVKGKIHDTVIVAKLAQENRFSFRLKDLAAKLPNGIVKFEDMVDNYKKTFKITSYRAIPHELIVQYANADVWNCFQEFITDYPTLIKEGLVGIYEEELQVSIIAWFMERKGMRLDKEYEMPLKADLKKLRNDAEQAVYDEAGEIFNINSGAQLYKILMKLGVDKSLIQIKAETGNPILDKNALKKLSEKHNVTIVNKILTFKQNEKLLNTYAMGIYDQHDSEDIAHCGINTAEAVTGRMSITKPALQTLPKKDKRIRNMFIPRESRTFWFLDLDQVEYRLFAHYAQATGLIALIKDGYDVHQATASIIFNEPIEEVTEDQRSRGKTINFALVYGMGDEALADALNLSLSEAIKMKERYFAGLPEAKPFVNSVQRVCRTRGWIKNFYGRRRRLKSSEVYKAVNSLIQGCAADYIKAKLIRITKYILLNDLDIIPVLPIHDEIIYDVADGMEEYMWTIRWLQSEFEEFRVPITAGVETTSERWGKKTEPSEVKFNLLTKEEVNTIDSYNLFNGKLFDLCS